MTILENVKVTAMLTFLDIQFRYHLTKSM